MFSFAYALWVAASFRHAVVTFAGLGPLRIGMSAAEVRQVAGDLVRSDPPDNDCYYPMNDLRDVAVMIRDRYVVRIEAVGRNHPTAAGLYVGDALGRVRTLYAGRYEVESHAYIPEGSYFVIRSRLSTVARWRWYCCREFAVIVRTYRHGRRPMLASEPYQREQWLGSKSDRPFHQLPTKNFL